MIFRKKLFLLSLVVYCPLFAEPLKITTECPHAILINAQTGAVLYEKKAHEPVYPASTMKIATILYALEKKGKDLEEMVECKKEALRRIDPQKKEDSGFTHPAYWIDTDAESIDLIAGEKLSLASLIEGALINSRNDAANVIAHHVSGSVPQFMHELNHYICNTLKLKQTFLQNPNGLHHPEHKSTAAEMVKIAQLAVKHPLIREIVAKTEFNRPGTAKQKGSVRLQTNRLVRSNQKEYYPYAKGLKTGQHKAAGYCLLAYAEKDGRELIAGLYKGADKAKRYRDAVKMFEAAFSEEKFSRLLFRSDETLFERVIEGARSPLIAGFKENIYLDYYPSEEPSIKTHLHWSSNLTLPILKDTIVAEIVVTDESGYEHKRVPLYAQKKVKMKWLHANKSFLTITLIGLVFLFPLLWFFVQRRRV